MVPQERLFITSICHTRASPTWLPKERGRESKGKRRGERVKGVWHWGCVLHQNSFWSEWTPPDQSPWYELPRPVGHVTSSSAKDGRFPRQSLWLHHAPTQGNMHFMHHLPDMGKPSCWSVAIFNQPSRFKDLQVSKCYFLTEVANPEGGEWWLLVYAPVVSLVSHWLKLISLPVPGGTHGGQKRWTSSPLTTKGA